MEISLGLGCNNQQLSIFGFVGQIEVPQNGYLNGVLCTGVFYGVPHGQTLAHMKLLRLATLVTGLSEVNCWMYTLWFSEKHRELENHHMNYANQLFSWTMFNSQTVSKLFNDHSRAVFRGTIHRVRLDDPQHAVQMASMAGSWSQKPYYGWIWMEKSHESLTFNIPIDPNTVWEAT